ncbi:MAG: hypothetical protein PHP02_09085 [Eubacteriales bacterium]|nr:hypothetical protein [Eubacteriales bacterium]
MKKVFTLVLTGLLALTLIYGAVAETPAAGTAPEAQASVPTLTAEELDALLATKLEGGSTLGDVLTQTGVLDTFKSAQPFQQVQILRAQLTLGKISLADAQALLTALHTGLVGENAGNAGFGPWASSDEKGGNWNRGGMMGGRRGMGGRRNANPNVSPNGFRGGRMHGGRGMMGGMMGGWQGAGQGWQNHPCPYFQQQTTPDTTPENP